MAQEKSAILNQRTFIDNQSNVIQLPHIATTHVVGRIIVDFVQQINYSEHQYPPYLGPPQAWLLYLLTNIQRFVVFIDILNSFLIGHVYIQSISKQINRF